MDKNTVFIRTIKGEDEVHSRTMHLPGDIKRALLMVDGTATCGEISKRAAPSLRAGLDAMLQELEKGGYIGDKAKAGNFPKTSFSPKMFAPSKMATPHKKQPSDEDAGDLDFMFGFSTSSSKASEAEPNEAAVDAEKLKAEDEAIAKQEVEAAKLKAQQEAEAIVHKAEQEATRIREEEREKQRAAVKVEAQARAMIEAKARQEADAARIKAEIEARTLAEEKARQEIEIARLQAQREAEIARIKAEQEVANVREETAASLRVRQKAEAMQIKQANELNEADKPRPDVASTARTTSATVLFFDVVGYTKQPVNKQIEIKKQFNELVSACLRVAVEGDRIILDTGDGAAIGFLQHPEDALEVAMKFRKAAIANQHMDFPDLKVRIGIHLGPINISKDMNGRSNMVGDGINDAQRVMSFAGIDQIYISRPYYDFVSRLKDEYADMFRYRGMQEDKHGREHPVYEFVEAASVGDAVLSEFSGSAGEKQPNPFYSSNGTPSAAKSDTFAFDSFQVDIPQPLVVPPKKEKISPAQHPDDAARAVQPAEARQPVQQEAPPFVASKPLVGKPSQEEIQQASQERIATEKRMDEEALAAKKHAEVQAKARVEAEQRAAEAARAEIDQAATQVKYSVDATPTAAAAKPAPVARVRRKPFSLRRLAGFMFKLGVFLLVLMLGALFVIPYVLPTRDYMPKVEKFLSAKLHQPVHIGHLSGRILPTPRLELGEIYIGEVKQFQAEQALINFAFTGLLTEAKPIDSIELQGVKVSGAGLQSVSAWMQQLAADNQYPVARMVIGQGTLDADVVKLTGVEGTLNFNKIGEFTNANLRLNAGQYLLDINSTLGNKLKIAITVRGSALPMLPNWPFDELTAKGELSNNDLSISEFEGKIFGGILQGNASIGWRSGWRAQGNLVAKTITMQRLNNLLEGNVEGSAHFKMSAVDLAGLADSAALDGSFMVKNGMISGMDIIETARTRSEEHLPGGRTHFDELSGDLNYANGDYHFRAVKMSAGVLNATGTLDIAKQQISGHIMADLTMRAGMGSVALQVGGMTNSLSLRATR